MYPQRTATHEPPARVPRTEHAHILLLHVRASAVTRRRDGGRWVLALDGAPVADTVPWSLSLLDRAGLLVWLPYEPGWQTAGLSPAGERALFLWDAEVFGSPQVGGAA